MHISQKQFGQFKKIVDKFIKVIKAPKKDAWRKEGWSNDKIWQKMIDQIGVVGGADKIQNLQPYRKELAYRYLLSIQGKKNKERHVHHIFRKANIRYTAKNLDFCKKSKSVIKNLMYLYENGRDQGPIHFLEQLSMLNTDYEKVNQVMEVFSYIKSKGSRDFLIELGLIKDALAFDVRLQKILDNLDIEAPKDFTKSEKRYRIVENTLLQYVCKPLGITGAHLDRILFNKYKEIIEMIN